MIHRRFMVHHAKNRSMVMAWYPWIMHESRMTFHEQGEILDFSRQRTATSVTLKTTPQLQS